ncbi:MAG TPA: class I SAM-dependent methyltransferase [Flavobacteriales bacterium]|jgi:ubiquinone/menaquinone biosynthesis C-methylase UbiE|nr:class I SAM-dependent methyltransferase [Flavobacteriales bacterium]
MSAVKRSYDRWAEQYDTNANRTRDREGEALRAALGGRTFEHVLEIGCGTGKNTAWLKEHAKAITAVDLSEGMLAKAREKVAAPHVRFLQADILQPWPFGHAQYDLVTFSLMLEHVQDLGPPLREAAEALRPGGLVYIGELHPFKQYGGTKAHFETDAGTQVVDCFDHHVSDFVRAAQQADLELIDLHEHFDDAERTGVPRVLVLLLRKDQ